MRSWISILNLLLAVLGLTAAFTSIVRPDRPVTGNDVLFAIGMGLIGLATVILAIQTLDSKK